LSALALFIGNGWAQSALSKRSVSVESGAVNMSALPAFSEEEIAERDAEEEAPNHSAVGDFALPASVVQKKQLQSNVTAGSTLTASASSTTTATASFNTSLQAAASFNAQTSPAPAVSFRAQPMVSNAPPDTTGAVSANYVMSVSNDAIVIQDRSGTTLKTTNLNSFWTAAFGSAITPAWDPNVRYDPYADRWILVDMGAYGLSGSSMLIAVSATNDPRGTWYLRRVLSDSTTTTFDHPRVGFSKNWIVVTGNQVQNASPNNFLYSVVYVYNKADLYANGSLPPQEFSNLTTAFTLTPALTYDNTIDTMYLMANYNGNSGGQGYLSLSTITGTVNSPVLNLNAVFPSTSSTWASTVSQNFAPQLGSAQKIGVFDARMNTVVYRNGSLWATHTVFVPAASPTRSAVDWWQVATDGTVQQFGRLEDTGGTYFYTYPSLAVNVNGDMLVGYSRMSSNSYGSGAYAFRAAADPTGTLRQEYVMSSGQGGGQNTYVRLDGNGINRWGDYSATQVDPVNDTDFWTVQEYASATANSWAMWWDSVIAPALSGPALQSVSVNPAVVTGPQSSTGTVTLNMSTPAALSVDLGSTNSAAQVPANVTVAQNASSANFQITTNAVSTPTTGNISAAYNGVTNYASFTVNPPVALQSVSVNPSTATGGHVVTGTVTLNVAATSALSVSLSSANSAVASVPASVNVAAGASSANFTINTSNVSASTPVTISASYSGVTKNTTLTVVPPGAVPLGVVQARQNFNGGTASSIAAAITSTAGNLLVAYVREGSSPTDNFTVTDNLGQSWTPAGYNTFNSANRSGIFYRANSGAVSSVTANFTTGGGVVRSGIVVYEIVGAAASSPVDAGPVANTAGTTSGITSAPLTTSNPNDILLMAVDVAGDQSGTNNSFVPGAGFNFAATGAATNTRQAVAYAIVAATQTNATASMSWAVSAGGAGSQFIAFKPDAGAAALQSVGLNPTTVTGSQSSTGTVTLSSAAPIGGAVVSLSSNNAAAQVPAGGTVTVAAGATTATFTITTSSVASATAATISAVYSGVTKTAGLTINPLPTLLSVGVNPTSLLGGNSSTGTVTLSSAAPTGGTLVGLSSNNAAAQVPVSVTVAAGATTATFTITTSSVSSTATATISAAYNNVIKTATLTVNPLLLQSLTVSPTTVGGGQSASGTVTLNGAAPAGGAVVSVSSNSAAAQVPAGGTVTVPAGSTSVIFPISTSKVSSPITVTISASYNGGTVQTATLNITPLSVVQARSAFSTKSAASVTANIASTAGDMLVAFVREGSNATDNFTVTDNLGQQWTLAGYNSFGSSERCGIYYKANSGVVSSVTANFTTGGGVSRPGIVIYEIAGAATLDAGPAGTSFTASLTSATSAPLSSTNANAILLFAVDLANNESGTNNGFVPGAGFAFPATGTATNTRQAVSYAIVSSLQSNLTTSMSWASSSRGGATQFVSFAPLPNGAASIQSVSVSPDTVTGGNSPTGTVNLSAPAPAGGAVVTLSSNNAAAQVPASVTVLQGQTSVTFSISTSAVGAVTTATITAGYNGLGTTTLTVNPPFGLQSVGVSPSTVTGGQSSTGTVTLSGVAPSDTVVALQSSDAAAQVPAGGTVTVPQGSSSTTFQITTSTIAVATPVTITATYNGVSPTTTLTVNPAPSLQTVGVNPSTLTAGQSSTGTVTLTGAAPAGGITVSVSSNDPAAQVPVGGTVTVLQGATSATFSISTSAVAVSTPVTISASYKGVTKTASLTVNPVGAAPPLSVVQAQQNLNPNSGVGSISANIATTSGNLLVAFVREGSNPTDNFTVSDNLGQSWSLAGYNSFNGTNRSAIFYMSNSAAVSSVTATFTTTGGVTRAGIVVYEIAGAATTSPVDVGPLNNTFGASQTSLTSAPMSTLTADDILLFAVDLSVNQAGTNNGFVPGAGFAFPSTGLATNARQAVSYEIVSATQTGLTSSMNWATAADQGGSMFVAFKAASISQVAQLTPRAAALTFSNTQQFSASFSATGWSVDGVAGGSAGSGTITSSGLYTPPGSVGTHTITATGASKSASATVYITNYPGTFTQHNDNMRSGQSLGETVLTPANVNAASFGKILSYPVDGFIYGQPLYIENVAIPGQGTHNVVFVTTEHDSVYAFDADGKQSTPLWHVSFINPAAGITSIPSSEFGVSTPPETGITSTPVIDVATGTMYLDANTKEVVGGNTTYAHRLHALDIATGAEKFGGPVLVQAQVPGTAPDAVNGVVSFNPFWENQRAALLLLNGVVYLTFGSHGDNGPYHGWVIGYNATTLQQTMAFNNTRNGTEGGIWQSGCGPAADAAGNIYVIAGDGSFDTSTPRANYGESFIKLNAAGAVTDFFTPYDFATLNPANLDLGTAGTLLLPDQPGNAPHLLVSVGKQGTVYLLNRDNMGQYSSTQNNVVQQLVQVMAGVYSTPAYWQGSVYLSPHAQPMRAYQLSNGLLSTTPTSQSTTSFVRATPSISSNGASSGILWATHWSGNTTPGILYAYDAADLTHELYNTSQAGSRDTLDVAVKFSSPTVANGKVYVGMKSSLVVLGLLP